jgi:hypothetical protein
MFKLDTTDLGDLFKIVVRMDVTKGTGLFGKVDDWYLLKVGSKVIPTPAIVWPFGH